MKKKLKTALRLSQIVGIVKRLNDKLLNWVKNTKNVPNTEDDIKKSSESK